MQTKITQLGKEVKLAIPALVEEIFYSNSHNCGLLSHLLLYFDSPYYKHYGPRIEFIVIAFMLKILCIAIENM